MSCNLRDEHQSQESDSRASKGGECRSGSGDHPIRQGDADEAVVQNPSQEKSLSTNGGNPVSKAKGKRKVLEVESSTASGGAKTGPGFTRKALRKRLTFTQKMEILQLLKDNNLKQMEIARQYGCSRNAVSDIARNRTELETRKKLPGFNGEAKSDKSSELPQVEEQVVKMVGEAKRHGIPVKRDVICSFGQTAKKQLLSSTGLSEGERERLEKFGASVRWADKLMRRQGLVTKSPHREAGRVDRETAREGMDVIRRAADEEEEDIEYVHESGTIPAEISSCLDKVAKYAKSIGDLHAMALVDYLRESLRSNR